jgi:hypothetical protein
MSQLEELFEQPEFLFWGKEYKRAKLTHQEIMRIALRNPKMESPRASGPVVISHFMICECNERLGIRWVLDSDTENVSIHQSEDTSSENKPKETNAAKGITAGIFP